MTEPGEIRKLAIIGAGNQGPKIACRSIVSGLTTTLHDRYGEALEKADKQIGSWLDEYWSGERVSPEEIGDVRARLTLEHDLSGAVSKSDLIIECVPEDLQIKRQAFTEIDRLAPASALLGTNSSSLPCSMLADAVSRPELLFNINFSHPENPGDMLVELMKGRLTSNDTLLVAEGFIRTLGMVPIVTLKEIMGFSFNRTWRAVKKEVLYLIDRGYASPEDLDRAWILEFGSPWGPFGLMDIIGLDTVRDIESQYYLESGDESDRPPRMLDEMIARGELGVKAGRGFYSYPDPAYRDPTWLRKEGPWRDDLRSRLEKETEEKP
jgi:3-hydroxybutyryl-CoA dehydrogenase